MSQVPTSVNGISGKNPVPRGLLFLPVLLLMAGPAWGHGDAAWIMQDTKTSYCCGPSDCERAPLSAIRATRGGWLVIATGQVFNEGDPDLHMSKDQDFWWCRPPNLGGKVKCLFAPAGGV